MVASWRGMRVVMPDCDSPESVDGTDAVPGDFSFDFGFQISTKKEFYV